MRRRYVVRPCDNGGTVEGLARDRTWAIIDTETGACVADYDRRKDARDESRELNAK